MCGKWRRLAIDSVASRFNRRDIAGSGSQQGIAMSDEPENLVLVYLRRLDSKMDKLADDMLEVKQRIGHLEGQYASISRRVDSLDIRLERVERRLDIVPVG
jgi:hypothetical protein